MRRLAALGLALAAAWSTAAHAGLSLEEALARQREQLPAAAEPRSLTPLGLDNAFREGITGAFGGPGNDIPPLLRPVVRGEGGLQLRARTTFADGLVEARLGAALWAGDDRTGTLDESSLSAPLGPGRIYASLERRHWGPSWTGSLILDGGARPVPAVGWRKDDDRPFRSPWLSWLGPWGMDVFAGQLDQERGPERPYLFGVRVQIMPVRGLELAASRVIQWGGSGRPETFGSLYNALIGKDNVDSSARSGEPGNQLAGFDARYTLRLAEATAISVYGQVIGEDEAGNLPSHNLASAGVDLAVPVGAARVRLFLEHANTTLRGAFGDPILGSAYRHAIYSDGYTQQGDPLAHPAGGDVVLTSFGAFVDAGAWSGVFMLHNGNAYPTAQLYPGGGRLRGANVELAMRLGPASRVGVAFFHWRDPQVSRNRGQLFWETALP